jgi:hypothetical protein
MKTDAFRDVLRKAGLDPLSEISLVGSTGNNRVFNVRSVARNLLLKEYSQHPSDPRDRFNSEKIFYSHLQQIGVSRIPKSLSWFEEDRLGLFEFLEGAKPSSAGPDLVQQALDFLFEINAQHSDHSAQIPLASEACFTLGDHLSCVQRRIDRLEGIETKSECHEKAVAFCRTSLIPRWEALRTDLLHAVHTRRLVSKRWLSPSDFGFHNSLIDQNGAARFFDFEYAGWDDPLKTVCDFFCQPAVPVSLTHLPGFADAIEARLQHVGFTRDAKLLLPVYEVKWCCIMLNDFLPAGEYRRNFSNPNLDWNARLEQQIQKCHTFFNARLR